MSDDKSVNDADDHKSRQELSRELIRLTERLDEEKRRSRKLACQLAGFNTQKPPEYNSCSPPDPALVKEADGEAGHQKELLQTIFDNVPVLLVMWDPRLQRFTLNRCAEETLGWTTEEANEIDFMKEVYPDEAYRAEVEKFMISLDSEWHEWTVRTKDGEDVPIDWTNIRLTDQTMLGIGVDLRERKQTEEMLRKSQDRYRQLLSLLPAAMYTCNEKGMITYYNEQAACLWGRSPRVGDPDEMFCGSFRLYGADGFPVTHHNAPIADVLQGGKKVRGQEIYMERPDGTRLCISVNIDPLLDEKGQICGAINVFTDITAHKHAEAQLQKLNLTLEHRVAERTEMAEKRTRQLQILTGELIEAEEKERRRIAMLLHDDLQQILVSARFQTEMLMSSLQDTATGPASTLLDTLIKATDSCRFLSHELNSFSIRGMDLETALRNIANRIQENHRLQTKLTINAPIGQVSEGIKIFIGRTVQELLFNCVKHSGTDSASLTITGRDNFLTVAVEDNGVGFDPGQLIIGGGKKGGIGLLGIRERCEALGGSFKIDSFPDKGSCFVLHVPFQETKADQERLSVSEMFRMLLEEYGLNGP